MHRKWKNSKTPHYLQRFKELRVRVENELKTKKFYFPKFNKCSGDTKQIYKLLNHLRCKSTDAGRIDHLCLKKSGIINEDIQIAEKFNEHFYNIAEIWHGTIKESNVSPSKLLELFFRMIFQFG